VHEIPLTRRGAQDPAREGSEAMTSRRRLLTAALVVVAGPSAPFARLLSAQSPISEADLDRASGARGIDLGTPSTRRVVRVPLETYVARVIAGEAEPNAPEAAQQAMAIAIRTFAIVNARRHAKDGFDLCDTTHCQVPRASTQTTRQAALATAGRILTFAGAPAEVFYSANCGGRTESAFEVWAGVNLPYLVPIEDDVHADDVPWTLDLTIAQIQMALRSAGFTGEDLDGIEIEERNESGRVRRLRLAGLTPATISGAAFRMAIGAGTLRSTAFSFERTDDRLRFSGRGYGHGVGMCVVGAARRARRGETADAILAAYFPGLRVSDLQAG
jgi:stage II sporulation protein D